jgi:hypothetical protein
MGEKDKMERWKSLRVTRFWLLPFPLLSFYPFTPKFLRLDKSAGRGIMAEKITFLRLPND